MNASSDAYRPESALIQLPRVVKARLTFGEDSEIFCDEKEFEQSKAVATAVPSIALPTTSNSLWGGLLFQKLRNGCYLRLLPGSGFPFVIVRDALAMGAWNNGTYKTDPKSAPEQWEVGQKPIWIPPLKAPMILPPMARYLEGLDVAIAKYPIGGWIDNNNTGYAVFDVRLEANDTEVSVTEGPQIIRYRGIAGVTTGGSTLAVVFPLLAMPRTSGLPSSDSNAGSMAGNSEHGNACTNCVFRVFPYDITGTVKWKQVASAEVDVDEWQFDINEEDINGDFLQFSINVVDNAPESGVLYTNWAMKVRI